MTFWGIIDIINRKGLDLSYKFFDINSWNRKEHFEHYRKLQCTFNLTSEIEISKFLEYTKQNGYKFYSSIICMISKIVNETLEFKIMKENEDFIIWDFLHPSFTIFNQKEETFSSIWCEYNQDKDTFIESIENDINKYKSSKQLFPKDNLPKNHFNISMIPWVSHSGFNLNVENIEDYFQPIITLGKYKNENNKTLLAVTVQIHHAVCDGFHISKFINTLQEYCNNPEKYL